MSESTGEATAPLNTNVSEAMRISDTVKLKRGLVAVLDALGVSLMTLNDAAEFVRLRDEIFQFTENVLETKLPGLEMKRLKRSTLNDTVVYTYETPGGVDLDEVERFCHVLRLFETRSITSAIPFRGALALGEFYMGDPQTVLGPAVVDAATWYEQADWVGIHATPHATMSIDALLKQSVVNRTLAHVLVDYPVPLKGDASKDRPKPILKAINWPKGFYLSHTRPDGNGTTEGLVLAQLTKRRMPKGTEAKYFNAMEFFRKIRDSQNLAERSRLG
jgi:hypothetical protein